MGSVLEALLELQDIELQLVDIRRQLQHKRQLVQRQGARLQAIRDKLAVEHEAVRRMQMDVDAIDVDLKGHMAQVSRLREHLNTVRTNKQYAAILAQLNNEKADASRLEAKALEMMANIEARRKAMAAYEEEERAEAARLEDLRAQAAAADAMFAPKVAELERRRAEAAKRLDAKILTLFERLSDRYEGEALAKIERTHPRKDEFMCSGCHMSLSAECYNALMIRDEVQTCRNCGRILHIDRSS